MENISDIFLKMDSNFVYFCFDLEAEFLRDKANDIVSMKEIAINSLYKGDSFCQEANKKSEAEYDLLDKVYFTHLVFGTTEKAETFFSAAYKELKRQLNWVDDITHGTKHKIFTPDIEKLAYKAAYAHSYEQFNTHILDEEIKSYRPVLIVQPSLGELLYDSSKEELSLERYIYPHKVAFMRSNTPEPLVKALHVIKPGESLSSDEEEDIYFLQRQFLDVTPYNH